MILYNPNLTNKTSINHQQSSYEVQETAMLDMYMLQLQLPIQLERAIFESC